MMPDKPIKPREEHPATLMFCTECHCHYLVMCKEHGSVYAIEIDTRDMSGSKGFKRT